jgi:hypothetical protein
MGDNADQSKVILPRHSWEKVGEFPRNAVPEIGDGNILVPDREEILGCQIRKHNPAPMNNCHRTEDFDSDLRISVRSGQCRNGPNTQKQVGQDEPAGIYL